MNIRSFFLQSAIVLFCLVILSSCLEGTSETTIREDGSGTTTFSMNFEQMVEMMGEKMFEGKEASPALFEKEMRAKMAEDSSDMKMDSLRREIEAAPGLHNFRLDFKGYAMNYTFDFDHFNDWKAFVESNKKGKELAGTGKPPVITAKGKKFTLNWSSSFDDMAGIFGGERDEKNEAVLEMMKPMFKDVKVTTIYHLPGKVKKVSDEEHMSISEDKRTVTYQVEMLDFMEGKLPVENSIMYKVLKPKK